MPFPALTEAQGRLDTKRKELADVFTEAGPDLDMSKIKSISGDSKAKVDAIRTLNEEIDGLAGEVEGYLAVEAAAAKARAGQDNGRPSGHREDGQEVPNPRASVESKSFGELFTASEAFTKRGRGSDGPSAHLDVEVKTLFQTSAGWAPQALRTGKVVEFATRPIQIIDLIPPNTTSQSSVVYMEETTFTNAAAEASEGGTYAESALALTEKNSPVRKIATFIPVTDEQLEDIPQVQGYVNNRLPFMLRQRLDSQILVGDGSAPNLKGFLNVSGIQTQAKSTDPAPDAIYKAMTKVRVTGRAMPDAVIYHPTNWQDVRLLRTADGLYIWGSPADSGPDRIWGLPVIQSDAITLGTALVGDYQNYTELDTRRGIDVQVSNSHSTFFIEGKQAIRADVRVAVVVYRPAALCSVTGL